MKDLWNRLESFHAKNASDMLFKLRPPTTQELVTAAEKRMKCSLPEDFRASLLVHDGEEDYDGDDARFDWMPGCDRLAPLAAIVEQWEDEQDRKQDDETDDKEILLEGRFRNVLWHSKRIPIAGSIDWDGDNTYLDLVPGPEGTTGQLVTMTTECDFAVLGTSFRAAMQRYVNALESGAWPKTDGGGHLHMADVFAAMPSR